MCHVLIIEDEPLIALLIEDALEQAGATSTAFAASQDQAVRLAAEQRPQFITSDVSLIQGTGPAAVQAILAAHGDIPVLFITATPDACHPCAPPGEIMVKPFTERDVATRFRALMAN